jgi:hypothetical protein
MPELATTITAESAAALREMVRRMDDGDREFDGFGAPVLNDPT